MPSKREPVKLSKSIKVRFATLAEKRAVARAAQGANLSISKFIARAAIKAAFLTERLPKRKAS